METLSISTSRAPGAFKAATGAASINRRQASSSSETPQQTTRQFPEPKAFDRDGNGKVNIFDFLPTHDHKEGSDAKVSQAIAGYRASVGLKVESLEQHNSNEESPVTKDPKAEAELSGVSLVA